MGVLRASGRCEIQHGPRMCTYPTHTLSMPQTRNATAAAYLVLLLGALIGNYALYLAVFPGGLAEHGCGRVWEALGWVRAQEDAASFSQRVALLWQCAERVQSPGALVLVGALWIALKGLAVPGSMVLCVALGGLMRKQLWLAQLIATICEVLGGALCFFLSGFIGKPLLEWLMPKVLKRFSEETQARKAKGDLFTLRYLFV